MRDSNYITQGKGATPSLAPAPKGLLQRSCNCGRAPGPGGECAECRRKRLPRKRYPQPRLFINQPGDRYEKEADRVAEIVMRAGEVAAPHALPDHRITPIQRHPNEPHQAGESSAPLAEVSSEVASGMTSLGGGQTLDTSTRAFFESRFGHEFGNVHVHTDSKAARIARAVNARAFTTGRDIVFGAGQYSPQTEEGKGLFAHELVHTLQQSGTAGLLQRFAFCGPKDQCPKRVKGESGRASGPMIVEKVTGSIAGLLVGNFAIAGSSVKKDLAANAEWTNFTSQIAAGSSSDWEILGFSDCTGSDTINGNLRKKRAEAVKAALPNKARAKVATSQAAPLQECMASNADETGRAKNRSALIWNVNIPAPAKAPSLAAVKGPFDDAKCGAIKSGMSKSKRDKITACIDHSRYVNEMNQAVSIMKQASTPYAPGIAAVYEAFIKKAVQAGQAAHPSPGSTQQHTLQNINIKISSQTSLPVSSVSLTLEQAGTQASNGSYSGGVITLNETSSATINTMLLGKKSEIERVMYAEAFHFFQGEVAVANRGARRKTPPGKVVREELDPELQKTYKPRFEAAVLPFWEEVLKAKTTLSPAEIPKKARVQVIAQWIRAAPETTDRIEEEVYLTLRTGKAFTVANFKSLSYGWVHTAAYWNPIFVNNAQMQAYLKSKKAEIDQKVVPVVREIQKAYLRARPAS